MDFFAEYSSDIERDVDIYLREFNIECDKLYTTYLLESSLDPVTVNGYKLMMEENEEKNSSPFMNFIHKTTKIIRNFLKDLGELIRNIFSRKQDATGEDFRNSQIFKEEEIRRLEEIDEEIKKGRKVVYAISKTTGKDYDQVADFLDDKARRVREFSGTKAAKRALTMAGGAASAVIARKLFTGIVNEGKAVMDDIEDTAKRIRGNADAEENLNKTTSKVRRLLSEVYKIGARSLRGASAFTDEELQARKDKINSNDKLTDEQKSKKINQLSKINKHSSKAEYITDALMGAVGADIAARSRGKY